MRGGSIGCLGLVVGGRFAPVRAMARTLLACNALLGTSLLSLCPLPPANLLELPTTK